MSLRDGASLQDILLAAEEARRFTKGLSEEEYLADDKTRRAVERCYTIMGEAVKRLTSELRRGNPKIPWAEIARVRDLFAHSYERVDHARLALSPRRSAPR